MTEKHVCPPYCHHCPDLGGDVMPMCYGLAAVQGSADHNDIERCICTSDREYERGLARRLATSPHIRPYLRDLLLAFADEDS